MNIMYISLCENLFNGIIRHTCRQSRIDISLRELESWHRNELFFCHPIRRVI